MQSSPLLSGAPAVRVPTHGLSEQEARPPIPTPTPRMSEGHLVEPGRDSAPERCSPGTLCGVRTGTYTCKEHVGGRQGRKGAWTVTAREAPLESSSVSPSSGSSDSGRGWEAAASQGRVSREGGTLLDLEGGP